MVVEKIYVLEVSIIEKNTIYQLFTGSMRVKSLDEFNREWDKVPTLIIAMTCDFLQVQEMFSNAMLHFKNAFLTTKCNHSSLCHS